jgi:hypothetical protein
MVKSQVINVHGDLSEENFDTRVNRVIKRRLRGKNYVSARLKER